MNILIKFVLLVVWISGIVLAKGFWWTLLAFLCPFYSWYLVVKQALIAGGII